MAADDPESRPAATRRFRGRRLFDRPVRQLHRGLGSVSEDLDGRWQRPAAPRASLQPRRITHCETALGPGRSDQVRSSSRSAFTLLAGQAPDARAAGTGYRRWPRGRLGQTLVRPARPSAESQRVQPRRPAPLSSDGCIRCHRAPLRARRGGRRSALEDRDATRRTSGSPSRRRARTGIAATGRCPPCAPLSIGSAAAAEVR